MTTRQTVRHESRLRRGSSAQARIVVLIVGLLAVTTTLIVAVTWTVLTIRDTDRADAVLRASAAEFNTLARTGIDPSTGKPFASTTALLEAAIEGAVPEPDQVQFSVYEHKALSRSARGYPQPIETDAKLLTAVDAMRNPHIATVETAEGPVRYLAVPVSGPDGSGAFVTSVVTDVAAGQVRGIVALVAGVGVASSVIGAAAGWLVTGRIMAPLNRLRAATEAISGRDLHHKIDESGTDDIRSVARAFNEMVDRLDEAFAAQRRFAADAGHELRTPLTVLRGHMELLSDDPDLRAEQQSILLEEIDRMSEMVEDLLSLTRLNRQPDLHMEEQKMGDVIAGWRKLAAGLEPREWTWISDDGAVLADPRRLNQVFLQLARNALAVTQAGSAVEVGMVTLSATDLIAARAAFGTGEEELRAGDVVAWIADSGPGIPPRERERVFEAFARGSARTPGGSGLGLTIISEIVSHHGGRVAIVDTRPVNRPQPWPPGACVAFTVPGAGAERPSRAGSESS